MTSHLIEEVAQKSDRFVELLSPHPAIQSIRRAGLMMALDLRDADLVQRAIRLGLKRGFVSDWFLFNPHCIRISPALIISHPEIDLACTMLWEYLD